jgi:antitoxin (DNA-binding transcriptional repressor) of toxin-antitoxin stability system
VTVTTITSREFNQDVARAKRAARDGPVIITDRDRPAHVLLTYEEYGRLERRGNGDAPPVRSLADALFHPGAAEIEFDPPRLGRELARPADLG